MTDQAIPVYEDDEISLLDILVTLAESWKLLVFSPLIAGVLAGGLSFLWPKTFESVAIVRLTEEELALLHAGPVLDPLIEKFGLLADAGGSLNSARQSLKSRLTFAMDKKTKLATVTAKASTPDTAQALNSGAILLVLEELKAKGSEKEFLEKIIAINNRGIQTAEDAQESIQRSLKKAWQSDQAQESALKNLSAISADIIKRSQENEELRQKLEVKGAEVYVQMPSLPDRIVSPRQGLIVVVSVFVSGFLVLIFIFIRKAICLANQDPEAVKKISMIKAFLGFRSV